LSYFVDAVHFAVHSSTSVSHHDTRLSDNVSIVYTTGRADVSAGSPCSSRLFIFEPPKNVIRLSGATVFPSGRKATQRGQPALPLAAGD